MAIKDHDGTASYEIGKIYDYDGTASYQIGKVYDYDGTASYQIYSADLDLIENFSNYTVTDWSLSGSVAWLGFKLSKANGALTYTSGSGKQTVVLKPAINLSAYQKLVITVSARTLSTAKGVRFGFSDQNSLQGDSCSKYVDIYNIGTYTISLSGITSSLYFRIRPINDTTATGTYTISELRLCT